ncbi:MAG: ABC transporter substrate-binding protein, partial [Dongiaceae bacterium]
MRRREVLQGLGALGIGVAMMPVGLRPARAGDEAIYFTWGGYDDPAMQVNYEKKYGALPEFAIYGDAEEGLQKMRAGFVADVIHPCSGDIPRWREAGIIRPIDTGRLKNWPNLFPELKALPAANHDGKTYMVPWEWGLTSITYRTDLVELPKGEESWSILWDEKNKGRISIIDSAEDAW